MKGIIRFLIAFLHIDWRNYWNCICILYDGLNYSETYKVNIRYS